jgi:hypothetical protein
MAFVQWFVVGVTVRMGGAIVSCKARHVTGCTCTGIAPQHLKSGYIENDLNKDASRFGRLEFDEKGPSHVQYSVNRTRPDQII